MSTYNAYGDKTTSPFRRWTVCARRHGDELAQVACRMLQQEDVGASQSLILLSASLTPAAPFANRSSKTRVSSLTYGCTGLEPNIADCDLNHRCDRSRAPQRDVAIRCHFVNRTMPSDDDSIGRSLTSLDEGLVELGHFQAEWQRWRDQIDDRVDQLEHEVGWPAPWMSALGSTINETQLTQLERRVEENARLLAELSSERNASTQLTRLQQRVEHNANVLADMLSERTASSDANETVDDASSADDVKASASTALKEDTGSIVPLFIGAGCAVVLGVVALVIVVLRRKGLGVSASGPPMMRLFSTVN